MISTIQLRDEVKKALEKLKERNNESYEEVIIKLLQAKNEAKRKKEELLIEGYKEMAEESLKITKEFEAIEGELDWEW